MKNKSPKPLSARQVAGYCQVNFKTVLKWIDEGKLKAYQLPDSGVNRIRVEDLVDFLKRFGLPIPDELRIEGLPRLLIVDDELSGINMIRRMLRTDDFDIDEAHDGFEAGRKVESFRPDIILLDLRMPGMTGQDVLREIKGNPATENIRVVILTGQVDNSEKKLLLGLGAEGVLEKPIDRTELLSLIGLPITRGKVEVKQDKI